MAKKRFTFADAKERIKVLEDAKAELEAELADIYDRVTDKDYYQGAALGAGITAVLFIVGILLF